MATSNLRENLQKIALGNGEESGLAQKTLALLNCSEDVLKSFEETREASEDTSCEGVSNNGMHEISNFINNNVNVEKEDETNKRIIDYFQKLVDPNLRVPIVIDDNRKEYKRDHFASGVEICPSMMTMEVATASFKALLNLSLINYVTLSNLSHGVEKGSERLIMQGINYSKTIDKAYIDLSNAQSGSVNNLTKQCAFAVTKNLWLNYAEFVAAPMDDVLQGMKDNDNELTMRMKFVDCTLNGNNVEDLSTILGNNTSFTIDFVRCNGGKELVDKFPKRVSHSH